MTQALREIVLRKRADLINAKRLCPVSHLKEKLRKQPPPRPFAASLSRTNGASLIAEMKKASPSAGLIRRNYDVREGARAYERGGAAALSILTEENFFLGRPADLLAAKRATGLPVLRKDFIFDPYQVYEARALGADAVLLIVALLRTSELKSLVLLCRRLGMDALVEAHSSAELSIALKSGSDLIGINSRNLRDLSMDPDLFRRLIPRVPAGKTVVAESGLKTARDVRRVAKLGATAVLVGEALLKQPNLEKAARALLGGSVNMRKSTDLN